MVWALSTMAMPLAALHPQGAPGCSLFASQCALELCWTGSGAFTTSLTLPNDPALAGQVLWQQAVPFELDVAGHIAALTSTNALKLTIGAF